MAKMVNAGKLAFIKRVEDNLRVCVGPESISIRFKCLMQICKNLNLTILFYHKICLSSDIGSLPQLERSRMQRSQYLPIPHSSRKSRSVANQYTDVPQQASSHKSVRGPPT